MENIKTLIKEILAEQSLIYFILSKVRRKDPEGFDKVTIRPILLKNEFVYQFTYHYQKKVMHENLEQNEAFCKMMELFETQFRQGQVYTPTGDYQILISKKFKVTLLKKPPSKEKPDLLHNRKKNYIIPENVPCSFMERLGVMNSNGKVLAPKYDKFRQINRFLEMVADVISHIQDKKEKINIIDFGCGKSYLTFALYHYLVDILHLDVNIIGLDLKKDVVEHCNKIVQDLGYEDLKFLVGDIEHFTGVNKVHMVVSLHACDTATDAALAKAIGWDADVILAVPCCQHELLKQIHHKVMEPMEKHGIIKERMAALITDSVRANILEIMGYGTQILEFISVEHTPKNLLIRAVKTGRNPENVVEEYKQFKKFWNVNPYLEKILGERFAAKLK
ncbi:SAM-dependent methyltransferase [Clostridiaceae bacterium 35-E11]